MPRVLERLFSTLTSPSPRVPAIGEWLLNEVWQTREYPHDDPISFLRSGEERVNELESVLCAGAWRLYDEFQALPEDNRNLLCFLTKQTPCAAVVFDGLSLREIPAILHLARESGYTVREVGFSQSAIPSETVDFIEERLRLPDTSPSQLPGRQNLKDRGIAAYYYSHPNYREQLDADSPALLIWSAFPDVTYKDSGARFAEHFAQLDQTLKTAWTNAVQQIPRGRRILVTSDHGYVFFGPGLSFPRQNVELAEITRRFGGQRSCRLESSEKMLEHPDIAVVSDHAGNPIMMLRGRVQTHVPGEQANRLYKHGGLSLMEMLTPWIVLE
jgi:hypothetical protein